ncbi:MAG TPA: NUDIX hydrolase [Pyrinomonadaceae bacterium]|nr:NUDIX hydrolase [Pyrinomonadaceae bacterium]
MEKKNGPWTIKESRRIYKNEFLELFEDKVVQPDGEDGEYATVRMKAGVCTLAIDDENNVYLTRQFRYALGAESLEVIAGGMDEGEPLENAKREAREEMGIEADEWIDLGAAETDTSIVSSRAHFFLARKLKFTEPQREGTEAMKSVKISFDEAVEKVLSGEIKHALSAVLILKAKLLENGKRKTENGK